MHISYIMKKLLCTLLVVILSQIICAERQYHFSNLSVKDGLSQLHVTCIYQDKLGYMWFGTRNGLNKFNGNSFDIFWNHANNDQSISNNIINCITEDNEGNLWVGTENGLNKLDKSRERFKRYYHSNQSGCNILSLCISQGDTLLVGTNSGLFFYDSSADSLKHIFLKELNNSSVNDILEKGDNLYLASGTKGLLV